MFTLYSMQRSGNSYKARLALAHLRVPYRLIEVDILKGESHTPEFLAKNPNGQVPLLEVAPGRYLAESNAILWYIAGGTPLAPEDRIGRAESLRRLFLADLGQRWPRIAATCARRLDGGRQSCAWRDGEAPRSARLLCRRPLHDRRYRAVRLHPHRAAMRLRPGAVSGDPRLARSRRRAARLCADGVPAGDRGPGGISGNFQENYSDLMPAASMIGHHLSISAL